MPDMETNGLGGFAMAIVGAGVIIGIGVYTVATMKSSLGSASADVNTTFDNTTSGAKSITTWFPILVVAAMGFLALGYFNSRG